MPKIYGEREREELRKRMQECGYTIPQLALLTRITANTLTRFGKIKSMNQVYLQKLDEVIADLERQRQQRKGA